MDFPRISFIILYKSFSSLQCITTNLPKYSCIQKKLANLVMKIYPYIYIYIYVTDKHLFFMDITQFSTTLVSAFLNSSAKTSSSSSIFLGFLFSTFHFTIDQMFSMGLTSGVLDGQSNTCGTFLLMNRLEILLVCFGSLSCCKRQFRRNCCLAVGRR
jgi:hypothetical protein